VRLASADALDLGRVQRVDLLPPLTLLLMANPQREIEQRAKAVFDRCVALDLAANVTDDAAKPRAQKLQFPPRAFELVGMRGNRAARLTDLSRSEKRAVRKSVFL